MQTGRGTEIEREELLEQMLEVERLRKELLEKRASAKLGVVRVLAESKDEKKEE